jgi:hypothetical protein
MILKLSNTGYSHQNDGALHREHKHMLASPEQPKLVFFLLYKGDEGLHDTHDGRQLVFTAISKIDGLASHTEHKHMLFMLCPVWIL